ncbi:sigma-70 family RNA polymerase sigma factor [Chitinophaga polysaccharea]|uniref:RNA polymerase sigma factor n=1 Tax=Chitinophaga TaxID=79328 RepID=UPI0014552E5B|nr:MULTISPECIES: sigma-70 family RNA polymerase sigma factor [Chitinophaga]NLR61815.1 sigma-70 family RNA polymerase sigma factor [Chitinophaga polysaccharea]NLU92683.1 sigma-70 family RNA polymerase sigma factor [Chitinophaga sp. Ak27]
MDKQAFLAAITQHQGMLHKLCRLYRDTPEDREDLFQEMIYQLWKSFPSFQGNAKISTWIYRIALNTALASFRKKSLPVTYTDTLPEIAQPDHRDNEQQELFFAALKQLSDAEKAIIALYLEDMSYQEIAGVIGIEENYVGVKLNRIKNKIKSILNL